MSDVILSKNIDVVNIVFSGKAYPEISRINGRISFQTVKDFLFAHGYMTIDNYKSDNTAYSVIVSGLFKAFQDGVLSLNSTKQDGVYNLTPVRVSTGLSGKLEDVFAVSTISLANAFCLARMKNPDIVCNKCYVSESLRIDGILAYTQNMYVLTHGLLPTEWIPQLKYEWAKNRIVKHAETEEEKSLEPLCRFESMGDLACTIQAQNYIAIAKQNPLFSFALWTKNPAVLAMAIDIDGKPENLATVWSMSRVNIMDSSNRYDSYFDHKFIVVDNDLDRDNYLEQDGFYSCHCGHRSCIRCRHCYHKMTHIDTAVERLRDKKQK